MDVEKVCNLIFLNYQLHSYTILVEFCVRLKTSDLCSVKKNSTFTFDFPLLSLGTTD
jgi:hypothetical protein